MADRNFESGLNYGKRRVYMDCSFVANGAGQPDPTLFLGSGIKSVVRTAAGTYTVTAEDAFQAIISKFADMDSAGTGAFGGCGAASPGTNKANPATFTVYTYAAAGTLADFTGNRVSLCACFRNTTVLK